MSWEENDALKDLLTPYTTQKPTFAMEFKSISLLLIQKQGFLRKEKFLQNILSLPKDIVGTIDFKEVCNNLELKNNDERVRKLFENSNQLEINNKMLFLEILLYAI